MKNIFKRLSNYSYKIRNSISTINHFKCSLDYPIISFSFDDFPESAAVIGAEILKKYGICGTFYISLGKLGQDSPVGKICDLETIKNLIEAGHEIGNHTYDHINPYYSPIEAYEESILKNEQACRELFSNDGFKTFAYPYGIVSVLTKGVAARHFRCSRSTNRGVNFDKIDLNMLKANPIYGEGENNELIESAIKFTTKVNGWLNLYTHDIRENHSVYGCTPDHFEMIVKSAVDSGAKIVTLQQACDIIGAPNKS